MSTPDDLEPGGGGGSGDGGNVTVVWHPDTGWEYAPGQSCPVGFVPEMPGQPGNQDGQTAVVACVEQP